jgi:hypothetical protein
LTAMMKMNAPLILVITKPVVAMSPLIVILAINAITIPATKFRDVKNHPLSAMMTMFVQTTIVFQHQVVPLCPMFVTITTFVPKMTALHPLKVVHILLFLVTTTNFAIFLLAIEFLDVSTLPRTVMIIIRVPMMAVARLLEIVPILL